jgi:hypothetical protein
MENINFSLQELEINTNNPPFDLSFFLAQEAAMQEEAMQEEAELDIEQLSLYYATYTSKSLQHILQYYGRPKHKMVKEEMIQVLLFFETDPANKAVTERRKRLWRNIHELKTDPYFSKYILF